jgi:hypothetical protein
MLITVPCGNCPQGYTSVWADIDLTTVNVDQSVNPPAIRALGGNGNPQAGYGMLITINPALGTVTYAVNPATVGILGGPNLWTGNNDFSTAVHTTPTKVGTFASIPASCIVGELYFATDKTAGQNLYGCTSADTWTLE